MKERKLGLLGKKVGMTTVYDDDGIARGVTVLQLGPCVVLQKRSTETNDKGKTDGYTALQLGFDEKPERKINKVAAGHLKKAGGLSKARRFVCELRVSSLSADKFEVGQSIGLADLGIKPGDKVDVAGRTIGKGFQGVVRKYSFRGFHKTHAHEVLRHGGSIGCRKFPGRVFKGQKMPGQMGAYNRTTQNIKVVQVRTDENVLLVHGSVPGAKNGYLTVRPAIKKNPLP
jgi:large subunit ribosomal protein L3